MLAVVVVLAACAQAVGSRHADEPDDVDNDPVVPDAHLEAPPPPTPPATWSFVVVSDLHLPNKKAATVDAMVKAIIGLHPRFVVITGDDTNGTEKGSGSMKWWDVVQTALQPFRDAKIPVLPVAGNHDTYGAEQKAKYAKAWANLADWAAPLAITPAPGKDGLARAPFAYSVDVDGVHLSLAHVVEQHLEKDVAAWLADDLKAASGAKLRLVFGHVPMSSVIAKPRDTMIKNFGAILAAGKADAYIAGHEHLVWDEDVGLPGGGTIRQIMVGCTSGAYNYGPTEDAEKRASCKKIDRKGDVDPELCHMPHGGGAFRLSRQRKGRRLQHALATFMVITIDGTSIDARPMTLDDQGSPVPFYLDDPSTSVVAR